MTIQVVRDVSWKDGSGTPGTIITESGLVVCRVLELPWRNNEPSMSRIPDGEYPLSRWRSAKYHGDREAIHVGDVPGRSYILMHGGNLAGNTRLDWKTHSLGCLLPCTRFGTLGKQKAGLVSLPALRRLRMLKPTRLIVSAAASYTLREAA